MSRSDVVSASVRRVRCQSAAPGNGRGAQSVRPQTRSGRTSEVGEMSRKCRRSLSMAVVRNGPHPGSEPARDRNIPGASSVFPAPGERGPVHARPPDDPPHPTVPRECRQGMKPSPRTGVVETARETVSNLQAGELIGVGRPLILEAGSDRYPRVPMDMPLAGLIFVARALQIAPVLGSVRAP